jgi:predicted double-glycine peptidase
VSLVLAAVAGLSGAEAASGAPPPERGAKAVRSLLEIRDDGVVRQHWDLSCGAAAIATLMTYELNDPVSERQVVLGMLKQTSPELVRARFGFSLLDLKRFAAGRGLFATAYGGMTVDGLLAVAPAIAPVKLSGFNHFVVVRGRLGDRLLLADPAFGNRTMTIAEFRKVWTDGVGFTVTRMGEPNPPNRMAAPPGQFLGPSSQAVRETVSNFGSGASTFGMGHR